MMLIKMKFSHLQNAKEVQLCLYEQQLKACHILLYVYVKQYTILYAVE